MMKMKFLLVLLVTSMLVLSCSENTSPPASEGPTNDGKNNTTKESLILSNESLQLSAPGATQENKVHTSDNISGIKKVSKKFSWESKSGKYYLSKISHHYSACKNSYESPWKKARFFVIDNAGKSSEIYPDNFFYINADSSYILEVVFEDLDCLNIGIGFEVEQF